jgi:hypothetical protein
MIRASRHVAALALSFALTTISAHAATIDLFTFNGPEIVGPLTASIPASPTPASSVAGVSFDLSGISATFEGNTLTGDVTFFTAGGAGGGGTIFTGPELFSGLVSSPTFILGTYSLSGMADLGNGGPELVTGTLTISQAGAVPEPLPVVMTGTGIFALMWILRRGRLHLHSSNLLC